MEKAVLSDKNIIPDDALIFSIIGDKELLWKQVFSYLHDHNKDVNSVWNYYNDGKSWLLKTQKKKKTLFWIRILEDTFRVAFYFGDKAEPMILQSNLPETIKTDFKNGKRYGKIRCISIEMEDSTDLENVEKLIDLKIRLK